MGLGLLKLVAVGNENVILNSEPEITFFKKVIENVSYFRIENIHSILNQFQHLVEELL